MAERVEYLLRGRKPSPWAEWVGLSQGTISRLKTGQLPNPDKLSIACRAENLSLTWLLEGIGAPYIVHNVTSTDEGTAHVRELIGEEEWRPLIVASARGSSLVLHMPGQARTEKGGTCDYRIVSVIGGDYDARRVAELLGLDRSPILTSIEVDNDEWQRLATGYMGSTELFGSLGQPGLYDVARREGRYDVRLTESFRLPSTVVHLVREPPPPYGDIPPDEVRALIAQLSESEREVVLRMLRGLKR